MFTLTKLLKMFILKSKADALKTILKFTTGCIKMCIIRCIKHWNHCIKKSGKLPVIRRN